MLTLAVSLLVVILVVLVVDRHEREKAFPPTLHEKRKRLFSLVGTEPKKLGYDLAFCLYFDGETEQASICTSDLYSVPSTLSPPSGQPETVVLGFQRLSLDLLFFLKSHGFEDWPKQDQRAFLRDLTRGLQTLFEASSESCFSEDVLELPDPLPEWVYTDLLLEDLHPEDMEGLDSLP